MKIWTVLTCAGLVLMSAVLFLQHDLRGWTPADWQAPGTIVKPTRPGATAFMIGECLPGTLTPWNAPTAEEYAGTATVTVLTCRSRTSAAMIVLAYMLLAAASLVIVLRQRRRQV